MSSWLRAAPSLLVTGSEVAGCGPLLSFIARYPIITFPGVVRFSITPSQSH